MDVHSHGNSDSDSGLRECAADVVIVGAGLAGLMAARELAMAGRSVVLVDKGRSVGGRMATRRLPASSSAVPESAVHESARESAVPEAGARLDHGAQFFTVRSPQFREHVDRWLEAGWVREWCRGFSPAGDGYPRYVGTDGMNMLTKHLADELLSLGVALHTGVTVHSVSGDSELLSVIDAGSSLRFTAPNVLLTAPVPQSLALLDNGWLPIDDAVRASLDTVSYVPCIALLATVAATGLLREPGGMQLTENEDPVWSFIGDNQRKGVSAVPAITFHANDVVSRTRFDDDSDDVHAYLRTEAERVVGAGALVSTDYKRWRYARPDVLHPDRCVSVAPLPGTQLVFAGDAFGEARVEGAVLSGHAAAAGIRGYVQ